jgi:hypothetical protein
LEQIDEANETLLVYLSSFFLSFFSSVLDLFFFFLFLERSNDIMMKTQAIDKRGDTRTSFKHHHCV